MEFCLPLYETAERVLWNASPSIRRESLPKMEALRTASDRKSFRVRIYRRDDRLSPRGPVPEPCKPDFPGFPALRSTASIFFHYVRCRNQQASFVDFRQTWYCSVWHRDGQHLSAMRRRAPGCIATEYRQLSWVRSFADFGSNREGNHRGTRATRNNIHPRL